MPQITTNFFFKLIAKFSFKKLNSNPITYLVFLSCIYITILTFQAAINNDIYLKNYIQICFWLWLTLIIPLIIEVTISKDKLNNFLVQESQHNSELYRKLYSINNLKNYRKISIDEINTHDYLHISAGERVPLNAVIIDGSITVDESLITGDSNFLQKDKYKNNELLAGTKICAGDAIIYINQIGDNTHIDKIEKKVNKIKREALSSYTTLNSLIIGLSIIFIIVSLNINIIAQHLEIEINQIYLIALTITLIPTTITALLPILNLVATNKLIEKNIIISENNVFEAAVDTNIVIFDKTGTVTDGNREIKEIFTFANHSIKDVAFAAYIASLHDTTYEGRSIKKYLERKFSFQANDIELTEYSFFPFTHSTKISGCKYKSVEVFKGAVKDICNYLDIESLKKLPIEILEKIKLIANEYGTSLLISKNKELIGVIHLNDKYAKNLQSIINKLHADNLKTILITGDNELIAKKIATEFGFKEIKYDATPIDKLEYVKELQEQGNIVAMYGDGINDSLALAKADIGINFYDKKILNTGNVKLLTKKLNAIIDIRNISKEILIKRGNITFFSLITDLVKYLFIVPALFSDKYPQLKILNLANLSNFNSAIISATIFNCLIIFMLFPYVLKFNENQQRKSFWLNTIFNLIIGILIPFISLKLIDKIITNLNLIL